MKKSVLIIGPFPPPTSGVSLANKVLAEGLKSEGWAVDIINSEYSKTITSNHGNISFEKLYFLKTYLSLYKVFFSRIVYITIGQSFFGVLKYSPFIILSSILHKKKVVHLHGGHLLNEYKQIKGLKKKVFKYLLSRFDCGIVLSQSLRKNFEPFLSSDNIVELPNFFQQTLFIPKEELMKKKVYKELRVVFLSNLIEEKGINVLLEAEKLLRERGVNIDIKIAGNKIRQNDLSAYLDSSDNIEYVGVVDGERKKELLMWSNVFCLPTYYKMEGQPISILEAMALGNLIVTTDHAGIKDICSDDNAVFCVKKSPIDLANKLESLFNNPSVIEEKGLYNYDYVHSIFSEEVFIKKANSIFYSV